MADTIRLVIRKTNREPIVFIFGEENMCNMSREHVRAMMGPQGLGYKAALRVLETRKARLDFRVYLEELRRAQLAAERLVVTASDEEGWCEPGCGVCAIARQRFGRASKKKVVHSIQPANDS